MRIDNNTPKFVPSTSASVNVSQSSDAGVPTVSRSTADQSLQVTQTVNSSGKSEGFSDLRQKPRQELTMDEKAWVDMIERANKRIMGSICNFEYSIHEQTKQIMVKVIDRDTKEIIREIPPEKVLDMVAHLWEAAGIIVDERR